MTQAREIHPGITYHVTHTTVGRQFLLRPDAVVNQVMLFCLFYAAKECDVLVHSVMVESNHFHAVITDVFGKLPKFMHRFDMLSAKCLIMHWEKQYPELYLAQIWSTAKYNAVVLPNANAVINAIAYDATNPIKDGLVKDFRDWPGLKSRPGNWLHAAQPVRRPAGLAFKDSNPKDRKVKVQYVVPPALRDRPVQRAVDDVHARIRDVTASIRKERALLGKSFLGAKAVTNMSPFDSPSTPRIKGKLTPTFAAGGDTALLKEGLKRVRAFRQSYRDCIQRFLAGARDVVFPAGTYLMRVRFGVACDDWSPPWCHAG
jgi:putative transposase